MWLISILFAVVQLHLRPGRVDESLQSGTVAPKSVLHYPKPRSNGFSVHLGHWFQTLGSAPPFIRRDQ